MRTLAGVVVACVLVTACGVRSQDRPEHLPPALLPSDLRPSSSAAPEPPAVPSAALVPVYLVEGERLVLELVPARRRAVQDALEALLRAGEAQGPRRSAVPPGTVVERVQQRGDRLSIDLSTHFASVRGRDQLLAVAQLVWTATEFPPVRQVVLVVDGRQIELPIDEGAVSRGPAGRDEYRTLGPVQ